MRSQRLRLSDQEQQARHTTHMLNNCYKQETPMTLFIASSYKTFKPFVQMTNLSKVGEGHSQTFGNPYKSIILKDNTVPMVTPKGEKWNMPLTLQRLIDHISGATWFDITKFALKIKSSIFVLVNWKKKKKFNPIWPFLRCSQRKTDFFWAGQPTFISITDSWAASALL